MTELDTRDFPVVSSGQTRWRRRCHALRERWIRRSECSPKLSNLLSLVATAVAFRVSICASAGHGQAIGRQMHAERTLGRPRCGEHHERDVEPTELEATCSRKLQTRNVRDRDRARMSVLGIQSLQPPPRLTRVTRLSTGQQLTCLSFSCA